MENKRSTGVIVFGIFFILLGIYGEMLVNFDFVPTGLRILLPLSILLPLGIFVLLLKEWARRFVVWLHILFLLVGICLSCYYLWPILTMGPNGVGEAMGILIAFSFRAVVYMVYSLSVIFFFTRPKVKEQFK